MATIRAASPSRLMRNFLCRRDGAGAIGIEGEQTMQAKARQRPRRQEQKQVGGQHQQQGGTDGERKQSQEPGLASLSIKVADGEPEGDRADERDQ